jgi:dihydrodipicolinate synthase/N-acetylneuraminate lyase
MPPLFTGVGVALVTLFDEDHRLDTAATADLAVRLTDLGMRSVLVAGTTGEASALDRDERRALVAAIARRTGEEHRAINARVNRQVGAASVAKATVDQLEKANRLLEREAAR